MLVRNDKHLSTGFCLVPYAAFFTSDVSDSQKIRSVHLTSIPYQKRKPMSQKQSPLNRRQKGLDRHSIKTNRGSLTWIYVRLQFHYYRNNYSIFCFGAVKFTELDPLSLSKHTFGIPFATVGKPQATQMRSKTPTGDILTFQNKATELNNYRQGFPCITCYIQKLLLFCPTGERLSNEYITFLKAFSIILLSNIPKLTPGGSNDQTP